jgi:CoA:oxalate CoA-transferase
MDGIETWSRRLSSQACLAALDANGVPCSAYRTVAEALADPQIAHRQALAEVTDGAGAFKVLNPPFRMSAADVTAGRHTASLGENTASILAEVGLSETEIVALGAK